MTRSSACTEPTPQKHGLLGRVLRRLLLLLSALAFFVLFAPAHAQGVVLGALLGLLPVFAIIRFPIGRKTHMRVRFIVCGLLLAFLGLLKFCSRWCASERLAQLYERVFRQAAGNGLTVFVIGIGLLVFLCAVPFCVGAMAYFGDDTVENTNKIGKLDAFLHTKRFYRLCIGASLCGLVVQIAFSFTMNLDSDEIFSLAMAKHRYGEIVSLTARDVHPPLYYFLLKFFSDAVRLLFPDVSVVYIGKLVSVLPYILLLTVIVTVVKKRWGMYAAGMSALCLAGTVSLNRCFINIRMYSWGAFFVFMAFLAYAELLKKDSLKNWVLFVFWSLAASYTQYFACAAVAVLYLFLLIAFVRRDRKRLKFWFVSSAVTVLAYLPWILVFFRQVSRVSGNYWIAPIGILEITSYFDYMFGNVLVLIVCVGGVVSCIKGLNAEEGAKASVGFALSAVSVPFCVMAVGVLASWLLRPLFVPRYMIPSLLCMWLGMSLAFAWQKRKTLRICFTALAVALCVLQTAFFMKTEAQNALDDRYAATEFLTEHPNAAFVSGTAYNLYALLTTQCENPCYYLTEETDFERMLAELFGSDKAVEPSSDLAKLAAEREEVYYVDFRQDGSFEQYLSESGLDREWIGTLRLFSNKEAKLYRLKPLPTAQP